MLDDLDVVLTWMARDMNELGKASDADRRAAEATRLRIEEIERRVEKYLANSDSADEPDIRNVGRARPSIPWERPRSWNAIRTDAVRHLTDRGVAIEEVDIDLLLDPEEVAFIDRRFAGGFSVNAKLDGYDIAFAATAGLAATVVDFFLVRMPRTVSWDNNIQLGSWLTEHLRFHAIDDDNWLARIAKVPFDRVTGLDLSGLSPQTHRAQTFGHDPLIGLVLGVMDILRGSMTGISKTGEIGIAQVGDPTTNNPFVALALELLHLASDAPTRMGLPLPGWSILMTAPVGDFDGLKVNELARQMYLRGYNSWHFLTMATVPATIQLVLRGYWGMRLQLDAEFAETVEHEAHLADTHHLSEHPRFLSLLLAAHGIATAGNIAKIIAYGGNPLAVNYDEWLTFLRAFFRWAQSKDVNPTEVLLRQNLRNQIALDEGWALLGLDEQFPTLNLSRSR